MSILQTMSPLLNDKNTAVSLCGDACVIDVHVAEPRGSPNMAGERIVEKMKANKGNSLPLFSPSTE